MVLFDLESLFLEFFRFSSPMEAIKSLCGFACDLKKLCSENSDTEYEVLSLGVVPHYKEELEKKSNPWVRIAGADNPSLAGAAHCQRDVEVCVTLDTPTLDTPTLDIIPLVTPLEITL